MNSVSEEKPQTPRDKREAFARQGAATCAKLLEAETRRVEFPGGSSRDSLRIHLPNPSVIATRRDQSERAVLEIAVLRELKQAGAPVPRVIAIGHGWVIQEDLGDQRLSQVLDKAKPALFETWLDRGLESLTQVHRAGARAKLAEHVVAIGHKPDRLRGLVETPSRIDQQLDLPAPVLKVENIIRTPHVESPTFIKMDARPGNAAVMANQRIG